MKQLILILLALVSTLFVIAGNVVLTTGTNTQPPPHIGEESLTSLSTSSLTTLSKSSTLKKVSSTVYYPVSAYVDEVALTVTFTQSVGVANVMVYNAMGQLVDMTSVDTTSDFDAVLSTETWATGSYTLVITYGTTTLSGTFDF